MVRAMLTEEDLTALRDLVGGEFDSRIPGLKVLVEETIEQKLKVFGDEIDKRFHEEFDSRIPGLKLLVEEAIEQKLETFGDRMDIRFKRD